MSMDNLKDRAKKILEKIDVSEKRRQIRELAAEAEKPDFWRDQQAAAEKMKRLAGLSEEVKKLEALSDYLKSESPDSGDGKDIGKMIADLEEKLYLSGPYDRSGAIMSIHSGQGGVEAMDWAEILYRMYSKFVTARGWKAVEVDFEPGAEAGLKTVTFEVSGNDVYGLLKHEAGVHRLVRQSPFNADNLRQTSFALVEVLPVVEGKEQATVMIDDSDLEWEFFRSGGHGGQNVNKVSSAVRLMHRPTGIVVTSQRERDQSRNRELALTILRARLLAIEEEKAREEEMRIKGKHVTPGWGNQIRSYVLHPYHLVKDLRTEYEETDSSAVLEGNLGGFIKAELLYFASG